MRNPALLSAFAGLLVTTGVVACGTTTVVEGPAPAATDPAPTTPVPTPAPTSTTPTPPDDHGAVSTTYPAFKPAIAQLVNNGGSVLKNPVIVTVTWDGDTNADVFESVGDTIGGGTYWSQVTAEYGAAAATSGTDYHVRLTSAPPTSMSTDDLDAFVAAKVADGTFPAVTTGNPVYILYLSTATALQIDGASACSQGVGGYHDSTKSGPSIAYAIVPQCKSSDVNTTTLSASHELAEATTDPYPMTQPAWYGFRDQDLAWTLANDFQVEDGDACEFFRDTELEAGTDSALTFTTQRQWSNKSGAAGHDPCVPVFANQVFYNVTPLDLEDVSVDLTRYGYGPVTTKGYTVPVGGSKIIPLGFYSDGAIKPWTIEAVAGGVAARSSADVDLTLDVKQGQNGQKAYLTVTVNSAGKSGYELLSIKSTYNGNTHYMPLIIASPAK